MRAAPAEAPPTIEGIFAAYARATHSGATTTVETAGTITGEGLSGTFHSWRRGDDERDDETLGPRSETTLRIGNRIWLQNANGNVHELTGVLYRRALTDEFINSGDFLTHPSSAHYLGFGTVGDRRTWRVEVDADGGEPETLWIDAESGLPLRTEYVDGDGTTYVDASDWRTVQGQMVAFHAVTTDGDHAFDLVEQTTLVRIDGPIGDDRFAPLDSRAFETPDVVTVPLVPVGDHVGVRVAIDGTSHLFLVDSGSQGVLLDTRLARTLGLDASGALEVRGAVRTGGMRVARLPRLAVGDVPMDDLVISTTDLHALFGGAAVDGILGYPFLAAGLVQLDFAGGVMRFGPLGSFVPPGERIPLDVDRELPEATVRLDDRIDAPFVIDSGNSGELLLYHPFVDQHRGIVPATGPSSTNYGVGGSDAAYRTRLRELQIGSVTLYQQTTDVILASTGAFADRVDAGNIGLGVLRNFVVTLDLAHSAMYLQPASTFDDGSHRLETTP